MAIAGIIAEYNPFHNGHAYQITQARHLTGCDSLIVAMSGDFVQRGTPAIIDKEIRTTTALHAGADMVLQIPVAYSTASAEAFAYGGVSLLVAAGIDTLVFGCEDTDIELLQALATLYVTEPDSYKQLLRSHLKEGLSFPSARSAATIAYFAEQNATSSVSAENTDRHFDKCSTVPLANLQCIEDILKKPNNILAIEYLKALRRLDMEGRLTKTVSICPIQRIGTDYHSLETSGDICSATALRQMLLTDASLRQFPPTPCNLSPASEHTPDPVLGNSWSNYVPSDSITLLNTYFLMNKPVCEDDFSGELLYCLTRQKKLGFSQFAEGNEEISNRVLNCLTEYNTFPSFSKHLQTKDITYARISRFLLHILLNITNEKMELLKRNPVPYIRVLGFKKGKSYLLSYISDQQCAPLLANIKNASDVLSPEALSLLEIDLFARDLYLTKINGRDDYRYPIIIL